MSEWNPRYVAYAVAHGQRNPEQMLADDWVTYPGGCMAGFMIWIDDRWDEFAAGNGWVRTSSGSRDHCMSEQDHADFDHAGGDV